MKHILFIAWAAGALFLFGCGLINGLIKVKVNVVSERTALENQILGAYNALDREMLLVASVRGVDPKGNIKASQPHSQDHKDALSAMQILDFHADDILSFKRLGWVGETNSGLIEAFALNKKTVPPPLKEFAQRYTQEEFRFVVSQVNDSRLAIMQRIIDMNENLAAADLPQIQKIFGKLNIENAAPGEKIQQPDGAWTVKQ